MKRYMNAAIVYAVLAMAGGVLYRELTRAAGYTGLTALRALHVHYFVLGMVLFLLLLLLERAFPFTGKGTGRVLVAYHIGLNLTAIMLAARGTVQVMGIPLASGADAAISGVAGIGHIVLGISLVLVLLQVRRGVTARAR